MARISLKLEDGTTADIEGTPEEVARLTKLLRGTRESATPKPAKVRKASVSKEESIDSIELVNTIKNCDEAEAIETQILDRSSQVDRVLLPLYILHEYFKNAVGLQTGEISTITKELGIPIQQPNVAKTLSGIASKYVMGDGVRKKGSPVRYKLSRKGLQYMKEVLEESSK